MCVRLRWWIGSTVGLTTKNTERTKKALSIFQEDEVTVSF